MGEGDSVPEVSNGTVIADVVPNERIDSGSGEKVDGKGQVEDMKEDGKDEEEDNVQKMEIDKEEVKEDEELKEQEKVGEKIDDDVPKANEETKEEVSEANEETKEEAGESKEEKEEEAAEAIGRKKDESAEAKEETKDDSAEATEGKKDESADAKEETKDEAGKEETKDEAAKVETEDEAVKVETKDEAATLETKDEAATLETKDEAGEVKGETMNEVIGNKVEMNDKAKAVDVGEEVNKQTDDPVVADEGNDDGNKVELDEERVDEEEVEDDKAMDAQENEEEIKERKNDSKEEKGSKKRSRSKSSSKGKSSAGEKDKNPKKEASKKKEAEPKTPTGPTIERPVRERKSVERLVAAIDNDAAKELRIERGRGTALKDIPNVQYKLTRKRHEDALKLLHTILFGRRGKAFQIRNNILRFSGFVWHDNEEKQRIKIKEKLDKYFKEKLVELCDVLDIQVSKANSRKEDVIVKLIEFLEAPHATTSELLSEKEQSSKGKKRNTSGNKSTESTSGSTPSNQPAKIRKRTGSAVGKVEQEKDFTDSGDESEEEEREEQEKDHERVNGLPEISEDEKSEQADSEEKENESESDSEEEKSEQRDTSKKKPTMKKCVEKSQKVVTSKKSSKPKSSPSKMVSEKSRGSDIIGSSPKSSKKRKAETVKEKPQTPKKKAKTVKEKPPTLKKSASKENSGKKAVKGKDEPKKEKLKPSDDQLKRAICEILKEVDFNTATFTDILKQLAKQFDADLTPQKSSIKLMIQDELTRLADDGDDE